MAAILKLRRGTSVPTLLESELFYHQTLDTVIVGDGTDSHILLKSGSNSVNYVSLSGDLTASNIRVQNDIRIGGNIYLGDSLANDNINIQASLSGSLIPSASNEYDLGSTTRYWRNTYLTSASILDITLPGSNIVSGSSQLTSSYDLRYLNTDGDSVFSQSLQVDHDATTNFVANEHINHTSVTISGGSGLTGGGHIGQSRTISLNTGSAHFNGGVKTKLNTETVISGSIQVDHDATTNFVANEHIDHTTVSISAGSGLTGGGTIASTRTLNVVSANNGIIVNSDNIELDNTSSVFTDGVKDKLNTETVISGSIQVDHDATTNFVANEHINHSSVSIIAGDGMSGGGNILSSKTLTLDTGSTHFNDGIKQKLNTETVISGSIQVVLNDADKTGFDTDDVVEGSNLYYTDARVKTKLNTETVISGSSQLTDEFDIRYLNTNGDSVVSSSEQVPMGGDISGNADDATVDKVKGVSLTSGEATQISNIDSVTISNTQWGYLGSSNQGIATTDNVTFADGDFTGDVQVTGNLTVLGSATEIQTSELRIEDKLITVASGSSDSSAADGAGLEIDGANKSLTWEHGTQQFVFDAKVSSSVGFKGEGGELTGIDTDQVAEAGNLYYTDTRVKTKLNNENVFSQSVQIDHDATTNFVANEHINHSGVSITAGDGLTGGGNITTTRTLNVVSANNGIVVNSNDIELDTDSTTFTDGVKSKLDTETVISASIQIDHDQTTNFVANEHIDHTSVSITAGNGLTGGGNISSTRTLNIGSGDGITVNSDSIQVDGTVLRTNGFGIVSGSDQVTSSLDLRYLEIQGDNVFSQSVQIDHDETTNFVANEHIDHTSVSITAGNGLTGGGNITSTRTLTLNTGSAHFTNGVVEALPNGTVSGSGQILDGTGIVSSSAFTSPSQGTLRPTINGVAQSDIDLGLELTDSPSFNGLSLTGLSSLNDTHFVALFSGSNGVIGKRTLATAAFYHVSSSISDGNTEVLGNAGAVKDYIDEALVAVGAGDITKVTAGLGMSGSTDSGEAVVAIDTGSTHFEEGVVKGLPTGIVSQSSQIDVTQTTNYGSINQYSDSDNLSYLNSLEVVSGSIVDQLPSGVVSGSTQITNGSGIVSGSTQITNGSGIISGSSQLTSSFVDLTSEQTISGLKTFNDIVVNGTGSFAYIESVTGTAKIIGDAFIILNNDTPTERYAGIAVYDSGSVGVTSSLQFDGQTNDWFYEYSDDGGVTTDHSVVMFGPEFSTKGSPTYNTNNTILKSNGGHHTLDSTITDDGTTITLGSAVDVSGITNFNDTTQSTSKTTGAVIIDGGVGIAKTLNVGEDVVAYSSSDRELKNNIQPISNPLEKINQISGNSFIWNEEKQNIYSGKDYGVIAQEIEEILPELVQTREDGYKAVKYDKLVSLLIEGIKDLSKEVQELKNKLG